MGRKKGSGSNVVKPPKYEIIKDCLPAEDAADAEVYRIFRLVMSTVTRHKNVLTEAQIGFVWDNSIRPNTDGKVMLGRARKVGDADKLFAGKDFFIFLNSQEWIHLTDEKRIALLDHELSHCDVCMDSEGGVKQDAKGNTVWRVRDHDLQEFHDVYGRRGPWSRDIEEFLAARKKDAESNK